MQKFVDVEKDATKASTLERLLNKRWSERRDSYIVMSKIDDKRERRVKDVIGMGRYSNRF